jgi:hypothetical protein
MSFLDGKLRVCVRHQIATSIITFDDALSELRREKIIFQADLKAGTKPPRPTHDIFSFLSSTFRVYDTL